MRTSILSPITGACLAALVGALAAGPALAGPCTDGIAEVSKAMARDPSLGGGVVSGALAGSGPSGPEAPNPRRDQNPTGDTSGVKSGDGATKELNAVSAGVATSPADVRRQQEGRPTAAQEADRETTRDRMSLAKTELEKARGLDSAGDAACQASLQQARVLMSGK